MTYKFELFLFTQKKMVHKYKIIQTLSSSNFIFRFKYMIRLIWFIYIRLIFYTKLTHLTQKKFIEKKKLD